MIGLQLLQNIRLNHRRRHAIHNHPLLRQFLAQRLRQSHHSRLRRTVVRRIRIPLLARNRRDIHNPPIPRPQHLRHHLVTAVKRSVQIDVHHPLPLRRIRLPHCRIRPRDPRIIYQDINLPHLRHRRRHRPTHRPQLSHIHFHRHYPTQPRQSHPSLFRRHPVQIPNHHARPRLQQALHNRSSNTPRATRHHRYPIL